MSAENICKKDLIVIGAGGFAREVIWLAERINTYKPTWNILGCLDMNVEPGTQIGGYPVLGGDTEVLKYPDAYYVCAVGASTSRRKIVRNLQQLLPMIHFATLVDPSVIVSNRVSIGEGCIICAGTIITVDITIGDHVIVNLDSTIGHDDVIGDFVTIYPSVNVSGCVTLGECVEIGTGTQIVQGHTIGKESIVGAGAVVVKDIPEKCTAVGAPAKPIKFHE